jgi:hypothetical protein
MQKVTAVLLFNSLGSPGKLVESASALVYIIVKHVTAKLYLPIFNVFARVSHTTVTIFTIEV